MWSGLPQKNRAILYMIGAIFFFAVMDMLAKGVSLRSGPVMALWARYTGQMIFVLILVAPGSGPSCAPNTPASSSCVRSSSSAPPPPSSPACPIWAWPKARRSWM